MAWTGFGGSWSNGVHSGGDDSGSIGGGSVGVRAPNTADIAAQYNSYGGKQITAAQVSNIRSDGSGGYKADIQGASNTVSTGGVSHTSNTLGSFSGVLTTSSSGNGNGGSTTGGNSTGSAHGWSVSPNNWSKLPDGYDTAVDGFKYHVALDLRGQATSVKQTAQRPYTKGENLKVAVAKSQNKKPGDLYPELDFSRGEPERQARAQKEAETAWKTLPPNIRSFELSVDGFSYSVTLDNYGNVTSTVKIKDRPYTKAENLKVAVAKSQNKNPGDLYPDLDFSKGEPQRKAQAEKNAQDMFSSFPTNPISIASDFYKSLADKFGVRLSDEAKSLAEAATGKKIRNASEAIAAFDKYKDVLNKKFSLADREAIAKALESLDKQMMAAQLKKFSKMFGIVGEALQWSDFVTGLVKGFRTGNWNDAIIGGEKIAASKLASLAVVVAFSSMAVTPIGIIGFAAILAVTSALITDERLKKMNDFILSR
ncbi:colicin pore forming domain-containing protein [Enterobacter sp. BIGb0383]|uniref:colicin-like pore-forming protein n=1 Tax=unclassified Enterobacter TaxID=2608935 RepID=UPI000F46D43B|nr:MULTISPECIES: colicin-like pore-forming protein [unclassified Enterobacter]ROP61800.1 colicin pore forming domain-containing protein [Enterobacter sp. BIGb0383]ROS11961.1 colicin pore forming domain-containing protein [Enterobacter sp. BIGb0359]